MECLSYAALARWHLGHPEQGYNRSCEALALARNLSHHHSLALALVWAAWLHQLRREPQAARQHAEAAVARCAEQGFPMFMSIESSPSRLVSNIAEKKLTPVMLPPGRFRLSRRHGQSHSIG